MTNPALFHSLGIHTQEIPHPWRMMVKAILQGRSMANAKARFFPY